VEEQYILVSPRDPPIGFSYFLIRNVHLLQSRIDEAIAWFEKARRTAAAAPVFSQPSRCCLRPQRGDRTRRHGTRRRPEAERRRSLLEHRTPEGRRIFRSAEGWRLVRSQLFRRPAQGRDARGVKGSSL
jgi:hypothetical protein